MLLNKALLKQNEKMRARIAELESEVARYKALEDVMNDAKQHYEDALNDAHEAERLAREAKDALVASLRELQGSIYGGEFK